MIGLIGESGQGKTTLINLLIGLLMSILSRSVFKIFVDLLIGFAKTAATIGIFFQRGLEMFFTKVRPVDIGVIILRIRPLPDQEIAQAVLTTGTDNQVRVRQATGIEIAANQFFGHIIGFNAVTHQILYRMDDFITPTVVKSHIQDELCVVLGFFAGVDDLLLQPI